MESLDLPKELYWDLKREPASPPSAVASELFALDEPSLAKFLYDDNFANGLMLLGEDESVSFQAAAALELLSDEDLVVEFLDFKDEECLLDQKAPQYIDYETSSFPQQLDVLSQAISPVTKFQIAEISATDYQTGDSELILQQLTPPQSPPQSDAYQQQQQQQQLLQELVKQEQKLQPYATDDTVNASAGVAYSFNNWAPGSEIAREIQLVDDIVNMRAQELQLYNDDCESQASSSLGSSSCSGSNISGNGSSIAEEDEEWLPESSSSSPAHTSGEEQSTALTSSSTSTKKRTRTYGRGVEDRRIRKKEQNKNAATRYRQKKKIEMENVLGEEQVLVEANAALRRTLTERRHELRYLRQLIREFYQGRKTSPKAQP